MTLVPCFLQLRKQSQSPQLHLLMRSCWDLAIDDMTEAWGIMYHLQVRRAGSGINALLLHSQGFPAETSRLQATEHHLWKFKLLCAPRDLTGGWFSIITFDVSSLVWPARTVTRSVLYMLLTTKVLHCGCLAVTALTACNSSAVMSLQLLEQRSTKPALRQSQNVLFKVLGWFMMINGSL